MRNGSLVSMFLMTVLGLVAAAAAQERRATWDAASFLQRLDRNGNATLEPDEMVGRAKGFIEKLGIDASGPVAIESVMGAINRQRNQAEQERTNKAVPSSNSEWSSPRLVPGFDVPSEVKRVPGFGPSTDAARGPSTSATNQAQNPPSESVVGQVDRVLNQYDLNKDQVLDANEIQRTPWGPPSPQESDGNGDGRLSRDELIERYRRRESDSARFNGTNASNDRQRSENSRSSAPSGTTVSGGSSLSTPSTRTTASPSRGVSNEARIDDYVRNLLQQYDSDHDGSLNADEQSKMKSTPKNADADANGVLSREELVGYYGGGYRKSATATNSAERSEANSAANNNEAASRSRRRDFRRRAEPAVNSSQFDGQKPIKMHDFATEWTAEKLKEFRDMDANHDGVITPEEYRSRK